MSALKVVLVARCQMGRQQIAAATQVGLGLERLTPSTVASSVYPHPRCILRWRRQCRWVPGGMQGLKARGGRGTRLQLHGAVSITHANSNTQHPG